MVYSGHSKIHHDWHSDFSPVELDSIFIFTLTLERVPLLGEAEAACYVK